MRILLFLLATFLHAQQCYFIPPSGWEIAHLKNPSPHVKIGFLGKGSTEFRPSINLATEEVDVSLKEYLKAVKELQLSEPGSKWRDLGKFAMHAGEGRLTEMTQTTPYGEIKILQAILVQGEMAYLLTAAVAKQDFAKFQANLLKSFRSLNLVSDLWAPISDPQKREQFQRLFTSLGKTEEKSQQWEILQNEVKTESQLGPYWQFLALTEGYAKIYSTEFPLDVR